MQHSISRLSSIAGAAVVALVLICGGVGYWGTAKGGQAIERLQHMNMLVQRHMEADMMHDAIRADIAAALAARDPSLGMSTGEIRKDAREHIDKFQVNVKEGLALADSPSTKAAMAALDAPLSAYASSAEEMLRLIGTNSASATKFFPTFQSRFDALEAAMETASEAIESASQEVAESDRRMAIVNKFAIAGSALLCVGLMVAFVAGARRFLVIPLVRLSETATSLARGRYEVDVTGTHRGDELGSMARALVELRQAGQDKKELERAVASTAQNLQDGTREIATASDELARRTQLQATSLDQTVVVMENLATSVRETASGAGSVSSSISDTQADAEEGGKVVRQAIAAMGNIEKSSQEISQIINVIDGIAFQTNLLALNAGVEAARAGDAGKGFAVVANEVRALAQRSADAAKDIKGLITASSSQVQSGVTLVGRTGEVLERIVGKVTEVAALVHQIAATADEQANGLQQINASVGEMGKSTQQNAAMVEESNSALCQLAHQATELHRLVLSLGGEAMPESKAIQAAAKPAPRVSRANTPPIVGNLALATPSGDDDWSDF